MLLGVAFLLAIPAVFAQNTVGLEAKKPFRTEHYQITYGFGVQQLNLDETNNQNERTRLINGLGRFNMNVDWFFKKFTIGFGMSIAGTGEKTSINSPEKTLKTSLASWGGRISYNLTNSEKFKIQPFAGYRFGSLGLRVNKNNNEQVISPNSYESVLNQKSTGDFKFTQFSQILELGVNFQYAIPLKTRTGETCSPCNCEKRSFVRERYIPIGLSLGYNLDLSQGSWKYGKQTVSEMPFVVNQSGFFLTLFVGINRDTKYYKN